MRDATLEEDYDAPPRAVLPKGRRDWATLIANVGVILGLLLLAFEVGQARLAIEQARVAMGVATETERSTDQQNLFLAQTDPVLRDAYVKMIREPEALSDADMIVLDGFLAAYTQQWSKIRTLIEVGLADEARLRAEVRINAEYLFGSRFGQAWWAREKLTWGEGSLIYDVADPIISNVDPDWMADRLDALAREMDAPVETMEPTP